MLAGRIRMARTIGQHATALSLNWATHMVCSALGPAACAVVDPTGTISTTLQSARYAVQQVNCLGDKGDEEQ